MQAVILAGGKGTRLQPLTHSIPKPLLPIGKKPILELIIEQLRDVEVEEIIITIEYKAELIKSYFRDGRHLGVKIRYYQEDGPSGTAGPLKLIESMIKDQPFITMNGDLLTDLDIAKMYQHHLKCNAEITMATATHTISSPYGVISMGKNGLIKSIKEKPHLDFLINAGIYVVSPSVLNLIPSGQSYGMPDLIQSVIDENGKMETFYIEGSWYDLGTMEAYQKINQMKMEEDQIPLTKNDKLM